MPKKNSEVSGNSNNESKSTKPYDIELKNQLEKDPWLRHLFNKIGKYVIATLENGMTIEGKLASIEFIKGYLRIEIQEYDATHFLDFRNIIDLKVIEGGKNDR
jgi:hypothetical protein